MSTETVVVEAPGPYGFKAQGQDGWINFSKNFDGDKSKFIKGREFVVDIYTAESGKKYVNKVLGTSESSFSGVATPIESVSVKSEPVKKAYVPKAKAAVSYEGRDFNAEALGKTECSLLAPLMVNMLKNPSDKDEVKALVEELALWVCRRGK